MKEYNFLDLVSSIPNLIFTIGALLMALHIIWFSWNLVEYIFLGGDDVERTHAKEGMLKASINIIILMILWAVGGYLYTIWPR